MPKSDNNSKIKLKIKKLNDSNLENNIIKHKRKKDDINLTNDERQKAEKILHLLLTEKENRMSNVDIIEKDENEVESVISSQPDMDESAVSEIKVYKPSTILTLFTAGFFRYIYWNIKVFFEETKNDEIIPQHFTFFLVILTALIPVFIVSVDYIFIDPPQNFKNLLSLVFISVVSLILAIHFRIGLSIVLVLTINIFQGFGIRHLAKENEFSVILLLTLLIQSALIVPTLDQFSRSKMVKLFSGTGQKHLFNWFTKLSAKCPNSISQFYRVYIYLISCILLMLTINIHVSSDIASNHFHWNNIVGNPVSTAYFIFVVSLALIILRTKATDNISGWGRNFYTNMKENFSIILSIYAMIMLLTILLIKFSQSKNVYSKLKFNEIFVKNYAVFDVMLIVLIFYAIVHIAMKLKSNPLYSIPSTTHCIINENKGEMPITFNFENKSTDSMNCQIIKMENIDLRTEVQNRDFSCHPKGITAFPFYYDKSKIQFKALSYGFVDISVSERNYKHRLYISALHISKNNSTKKEHNEYCETSDIIFDRYIIIKKFDFLANKALRLVSHLGLFNRSNKKCKVSVFNSDLLKSKSLEVSFVNDDTHFDDIIIEPDEHKKNIIEIRFKYNKNSAIFKENYITASLIFEINDHDQIKIPYILEIKPKIFNDTKNDVKIEYPDSSRHLIHSFEIVKPKGTGIPVKATYKNNKIKYFTINSGLTFLSEYDSSENNYSSKNNFDGFHTEISLVGLKGSGKTTYFSTLTKEATLEKSKLLLIPNIENTAVSKTISKYKRKLEKNLFPIETPENQFNAYDFQAKLFSKEYSLSISDIAGEFFEKKHINNKQKFCRKACEHYENSDFILLTIDTEPFRLNDKDDQNLILLRNLTESKSFFKEKLRILFTKVDKSKLNSNDIKQWMLKHMPQTGSYIFKILCINLSQMYFISVGEVEGAKIKKYSPQQIIDPIVDIIACA